MKKTTTENPIEVQSTDDILKSISKYIKNLEIDSERKMKKEMLVKLKRALKNVLEE